MAAMQAVRVGGCVTDMRVRMRICRFASIVLLMVCLCGCKQKSSAQRVYPSDIKDTFAAVCAAAKNTFGAGNCSVSTSRNSLCTSWFPDGEYTRPVMIDIDDQGRPSPRQEKYPAPQKRNTDCGFAGQESREWSLMVTCETVSSGTAVRAELQSRVSRYQSDTRGAAVQSISKTELIDRFEKRLEEYLGPPVKEPKK